MTTDLKPCPMPDCPDGVGQPALNAPGIVICDVCSFETYTRCWQALPRASESVLALRELADRVKCGHHACKELLKAIKRLTEPERGE